GAESARQFVEDVLCEVLADQFRPARQTLKETTAITSALGLCREMKQLQGRGPTFGTARQLRDVVGRKWALVDIREQPLDLPRSEAQIVGVDLDEITGESEPRQVEPGLHARCHHERDAGRQVAG